MTDTPGRSPDAGRQLVVAAWGGGVNSTAMVVEWLRRGHKIDLCLFADTGGEKPATYAYRDEVFAPYLKHEGVPFVTVSGNYRDKSLEAECLRSGTLPSLAYGFKRCSQKWKKAPQDVFVNNWQPAREAWARGEKIAKLIGFDAGEERRAKIAEDDKYTYRYPLIEWGVDRDGCVEVIEKAGLATPPKSSCFFCPASKLEEIRALAISNPDLMKRALAIEDGAMPNLTSMKGLGRRFAWREAIQALPIERALDIIDMSNEIPCECTDGDEQ